MRLVWALLVASLVLAACGDVGPAGRAGPSPAAAVDHSAHGADHDHECPGAGDRVGDRWRCETEHAVLHSEWPFDRLPTPDEWEAARRFAEVAEEEAVRRYTDVAAARADGFTFDDRLAHLESVRGHEIESAEAATLAAGTITHVVDERRANDGRPLDPREPDALMYATDGVRHVLVGLMFLAPPESRPEQVGGPLTTWHSHVKGDVVCWLGAAPVGFARLLPGDDRYRPSGGCPRGEALAESPRMLHVWFGPDRLADVFHSEMTDEQAGAVLSDPGAALRPPVPRA